MSGGRDGLIGDLVVTVENLPSAIVIATRYRTEKGYVLARTYELSEHERNRVRADPRYTEELLRKVKELSKEEIAQAVLGAAGISRT